MRVSFFTSSAGITLLDALLFSPRSLLSPPPVPSLSPDNCPLLSCGALYSPTFSLGCLSPPHPIRGEVPHPSLSTGPPFSTGHLTALFCGSFLSFPSLLGEGITYRFLNYLYIDVLIIVLIINVTILHIILYWFIYPPLAPRVGLPPCLLR